MYTRYNRYNTFFLKMGEFRVGAIPRLPLREYEIRRNSFNNIILIEYFRNIHIYFLYEVSIQPQECTVGGMRNTFSVIKLFIFQYYDSNLGLFSIASCKIIALKHLYCFIFVYYKFIISLLLQIKFSQQLDNA